MKDIIDCYNEEVTEAMDFIDFHYLHDYLIKKLDFEKGDNLMLVTCKMKMPGEYLLENDFDKTLYVTQKITEYIIRQINERMDKQDNPFHDMALLKIIDKYHFIKGGIAEPEYNTTYFYDIINIKRNTMDDVKQNVKNNPLGKGDNFKIKYESATGTEGKYTKPFDKCVYLEMPENPEEFLVNFVKFNQNIYNHDKETDFFFGSYKFNTIRKDCCVFKGKLRLFEVIERMPWANLRTKEEIERKKEFIEYEMTRHRSCDTYSTDADIWDD